MKKLGIKLNNKEVEDFFMKIVKETVDFRKSNNIERNDLMQLLINLRNRELKLDKISDTKDDDNHVIFYQNGLTFNDVVAQAFIFFFAGFETSSTTINFLMYEIIQQPKIQEKLRKEIIEVLNKYEGKVTYESLQEMTYLDQCVNGK